MEKLIVIKTLQQLDELREYIKENDFLAVDTETTGTEKGSAVIGFSVSAHVDLGYYVVLSYWDVEQQKIVELETKEAAKDILSLLLDKNLVMHNATFDCWMIEVNFGVALMEFVHTDTMLAGHLLDENRSNGLKELGVSIFGESAKEEQRLMKESVHKNGGVLTKELYELYKGDADLIARYGAKDTILTIKLFYLFMEQLMEQGLDKFFFEETMPLLRGPTYDLNTTGLRIDVDRIKKLQGEIEAECMELKAFIYKEIEPHIKDEYPGTRESNTFNIGSVTQISWLLFEKLGNEFSLLTKGGKTMCKDLKIKIPYSASAKREFVQTIRDSIGQVYTELRLNPKTKKMENPKKIRKYWSYLSTDKESLAPLAKKYEWVEKLLELSKQETILETYVTSIQDYLKYGIVYPQFLQHVTPTGRYSSKRPNFQNLPRDDKRVKACVIPRPGNVFVGADQSQLEPRSFASESKDERLMASFSKGEDIYSVIGAEIFNKKGCSLVKNAPNSFAQLYPKLRDKSKVVSLATPYGRTVSFMAQSLKVSREEARLIRDNYFSAYPKVELMMLNAHEEIKANGIVYSIFGRPRRIPEAMKIPTNYGNLPHEELPYEARNLLNQAMNHKVQSVAASIMNRAAIALYQSIKDLAKDDPRWLNVKIVLQVHDELVLEGPKDLAEDMSVLLKESMEHTVELPGVLLEAVPKIGNNLAELK